MGGRPTDVFAESPHDIYILAPSVRGPKSGCCLCVAEEGCTLASMSRVSTTDHECTAGTDVMVTAVQTVMNHTSLAPGTATDVGSKNLSGAVTFSAALTGEILIQAWQATIKNRDCWRHCHVSS